LSPSSVVKDADVRLAYETIFGAKQFLAWAVLLLDQPKRRRPCEPVARTSAQHALVSALNADGYALVHDWADFGVDLEALAAQAAVALRESTLWDSSCPLLPVQEQADGQGL